MEKTAEEPKQPLSAPDKSQVQPIGNQVLDHVPVTSQPDLERLWVVSCWIGQPKQTSWSEQLSRMFETLVLQTMFAREDIYSRLQRNSRKLDERKITTHSSYNSFLEKEL